MVVQNAEIWKWNQISDEISKYEKNCRFLNPNIMRAKNDKNTVKSTIIMNFTGSSDVLCLQQSFKEKLEFTSEFWVFPLLREV